jgi:hypothetical protein
MNSRGAPISPSDNASISAKRKASLALTKTTQSAHIPSTTTASASSNSNSRSNVVNASSAIGQSVAARKRRVESYEFNDED